MSPTVLSFYLADMSWSTKPVKRICYADRYNRMSFGSKDSGNGAHDQRLHDIDLLFPTNNCLI